MKKKCNKCGKYREIGEFHKKSKSKDGLHSYCKSCASAYNKAYKNKYREKEKAYKKEYRKENKEKINAYHKEWSKANPEKRAAYKKEWRKANPEKRAAYDQKRRARKAGNGGSFTAQEWRDLCEKYDSKCLCCKKKKKLTADHVVPISKGGTSNIENIQPLCKSCNSRKGNRRSTDYR
ncbi:MAG: HNH endonuclease [Chloroflexi bacterium]|nr:HNH endonuclease [Chloroflexota bacterium]